MNTNSSANQPVATFQNFEQAAQWAIETVDEGRLDRFELYDFIKDFLDGKDMSTWHQEDAIRRELAQDAA